MQKSYMLREQPCVISRTLALLIAIILMISSVGLVHPVYATSNELLNPITGTVQGAGYDESAGHYGIDLYPYSYGDPIYAVASGTIMYSCPRNHTSAVQTGDDCCTVKIILDEPITYNGTTYVCAFYTHMSSLVYDIYCGYKPACVSEYNAGLREGALPTESVHVEAGDVIGYAGKGNGATHLHLSFEASEADGYAMMPNSEYYEVFGWSYNGRIVAGEPVDNTVMAVTVSSSISLNRPLDADYTITCRQYYSSGKVHNAIDYGCPKGTPVYAAESGTVITHDGGFGDGYIGSTANGGWGNYIDITHENGYQTRYAHLTTGSFVVKSGETVERGQLIGYSGNSGNSSGPHLHFGLYLNGSKVYPESYITTANGYFIGDSGNDDTTTHTHSFTVTEYEALHPHKAYVKCSYSGCKEWQYTGATTYVASCSSCNTCSCSTSYAGTYVCATESLPLNIRDGHSTSSNIIGQIPSGASVTVTAGNGEWAHISYGGVSGYASMEYLTIPYTTSSVYPVPFKCYPLSDADHAADAYDAPGGNHIGYIYGSDYCTIKEVYSNGFCLVNCPWNGSTKDVYAYTGAFINTAYTPTTKIAEKRASTYIRHSSSTELGWIDAGDSIVITDKYGTRTQVIYPHTDGTYRCAWVDNSALVHTHTYGPTATCTAAQYCTTCDTLLVDKLDHSAGLAATCTTPQTCTRCGVILVGASDHTAGRAATCTTAQTCTVCGTILTPATGHSYSIGTYTDDEHPHIIYNICRCGELQNSGSTATVADCEICNPPVQYEVTFVTNGSQTTILPHYGEAGDIITLMSVTKDGYVFLGWDTDSSADVAVYKTGDSYTIHGDATLYAVWQKETVSVNGVSLNKTSATIDVGDTLSLTATVSPTDATSKAVTWASDNSSIATVANGTVTGIKAGTVTITVTTSDGGYKAQCVVTVNAKEIPADAPIVAVSSVRGQVGNTVTIPISIENNPGIVSMTLEVEYDAEIFTLVAVNDTTLLSGAMHSDVYSSPYTLTWENDTSKTNFYINGTVVELVFEISADAEPGDYVFSVNYPKDGIYDFDGTNINFTMKDGVCAVSEYILGDVNADGEVTNKDRLLLSRYLAKWSGYDISMLNFAAADINGDGEITNKDRLLLARHLAKWSGYENLSDL